MWIWMWIPSPQRKLAHKLAHARKGGGQERAFFSAVAKAFDEASAEGLEHKAFRDGVTAPYGVAAYGVTD